MTKRRPAGGGSLRIVAGEARGRRLAVPRGRAVRPTPDRVREALFSILGDRCVDACVADLCAGTGALGLEALSRGARSVLFVEEDPAVAEVLRENVARVALPGAEVVVRDARAALAALARQGAPAFDLVLADPPFAAGLVPPLARALVDGALLARGGLLVIEHPAGDALRLPGLRQVDARRYGSVALDFLESE
jgi:16S rRNA (guanine966-N2)-methyltransferase